MEGGGGGFYVVVYSCQIAYQTGFQRDHLCVLTTKVLPAMMMMMMMMAFVSAQRGNMQISPHIAQHRNLASGFLAEGSSELGTQTHQASHLQTTIMCFLQPPKTKSSTVLYSYLKQIKRQNKTPHWPIWTQSGVCSLSSLMRSSRTVIACFGNDGESSLCPGFRPFWRRGRMSS